MTALLSVAARACNQSFKSRITTRTTRRLQFSISYILIIHAIITFKLKMHIQESLSVFANLIVRIHIIANNGISNKTNKGNTTENDVIADNEAPSARAVNNN